MEWHSVTSPLKGPSQPSSVQYTPHSQLKSHLLKKFFSNPLKCSLLHKFIPCQKRPIFFYSLKIFPFEPKPESLVIEFYFSLFLGLGGAPSLEHNALSQSL